ncbi:MAG: adenylyltransferase/cytidyltransferase family protein [Alphaproteobacteria bacterium]|nr:adenylyltransferase/cytidyltransferase family protein [Alphaproteobacteria bacterium]MBV8548891.1 adenylyltransferase/cytidyltransferase family protein [Alphaproteobacteria bacterium]
MAGKTVITFGTYDLFHVGHLRLLQRARALGDRLVVGVSTDALNVSKKNFSPSIPQTDRIEIIRSLRCVDEAFFEESLELKGDYIRQFKADTLVMGHDWEGRFDHFRDLCEVAYLPRTEGISTTQIREDMIRRGFITYS